MVDRSTNGAPDGDRPSNDPSARVLAIAGCTNAGKTTISTALCTMLKNEGLSVKVISQDDFFLPMDKVRQQLSANGEHVFYDYDSVEALDEEGLLDAVMQECSRVDYVLIEGNMLTELKTLMKVVDRVVFLTLNKPTCKRRRDTRSYEPPDEPGFFDELVWPAYQLHLSNALAMARSDKRLTFLDASRDSDENEEEHVRKLIGTLSDDVVRITFDVLDVAEAMTIVSSPSCGGTSIFVGTTRDTFEGRPVLRLEYESYDEMAYKELRKLCTTMRSRFPTVERAVIFHRIGEVGVGEASVIIATASPHRADAIRATEWAIDELKRKVPIWKKETYADGGATWKENKESLPVPKPEQPSSTAEEASPPATEHPAHTAQCSHCPRPEWNAAPTVFPSASKESERPLRHSVAETRQPQRSAAAARSRADESRLRPGTFWL